jgi:formylglycine-generating enzyme
MGPGSRCEDWYEENYYANSPRRDPKGPSGGSIRVIRGGSWWGIGSNCRSAIRDRGAPAYRNNYLGFRVALVGHLACS